MGLQVVLVESCRWSFEGSLARNAFLRDSRCTKPLFFHPRTSMIYLCGATGARRSRVWSDHGLGIILGSCSDRFRIVNGVSSVFRACAVDRILHCDLQLIGSFPHCKWRKWFWWKVADGIPAVIWNSRIVPDRSLFSHCKWDCKWCWCDSDLSMEILEHFLQNPSDLQIIWRRDAGFGAAISDPVARISIVFCNSVSADRIVMAASRLLLATAACVILLSFAAGLRKSYWSGCMKAATVICQQIFSILALVIFLLKILLKSASKSSFFSLWRRDPVLELQFPTQLRVVLLCFATQSLQIAL